MNPIFTAIRDFFERQYRRAAQTKYVGEGGLIWSRLADESWRHISADAVREDTVESFLERHNAGISRAHSALAHYVDVRAEDLHNIIRVILSICRNKHENVHYWNAEKLWKPINSDEELIRVRAVHNGVVELAIVDSDNVLISRFTLVPWRQRNGFIDTSAQRIPVKRLPSFARCQSTDTDQTIEPIDVVFTWVNADDPDWLELYRAHKSQEAFDRNAPFTADEADRFRQSDELKYALRSVALFAPWVRRIHVFSNCNPPHWFRETEQYRWIRHQDVIPQDVLPLFNSHAIETYLHLIPDLQERYLYFNDDVFLSAPVYPDDFFDRYGRAASRMEPYGVIPNLIALVELGKAEEWQHAAVNSAKLLQERAGTLPLKLHRHVPHAFQRSVYQALLNTFPEAADKTRGARFRSAHDVSFSSFLYHHYSATNGKSFPIDEEAIIVRPSNYRRFLKSALHRQMRFFCINDGGGSSADVDFHRFKYTFLESVFPVGSPVERDRHCLVDNSIH